METERPTEFPGPRVGAGVSVFARRHTLKAMLTVSVAGEQHTLSEPASRVLRKSFRAVAEGVAYEKLCNLGILSGPLECHDRVISVSRRGLVQVVTLSMRIAEGNLDYCKRQWEEAIADWARAVGATFVGLEGAIHAEVSTD